MRAHAASTATMGARWPNLLVAGKDVNWALSRGVVGVGWPCLANWANQVGLHAPSCPCPYVTMNQPLGHLGFTFQMGYSTYTYFVMEILHKNNKFKFEHDIESLHLMGRLLSWFLRCC